MSTWEDEIVKVIYTYDTFFIRPLSIQLVNAQIYRGYSAAVENLNTKSI